MSGFGLKNPPSPLIKKEATENTTKCFFFSNFKTIFNNFFLFMKSEHSSSFQKPEIRFFFRGGGEEYQFQIQNVILQVSTTFESKVAYFRENCLTFLTKSLVLGKIYIKLYQSLQNFFVVSSGDLREWEKIYCLSTFFETP